MNKYALFLSLSFTILIASNYYLLIGSTNNLEQVVIKRAVDGDTIETSDGRTIRLLNINALEKEEKGSQKAIEFLQNFENMTVELEITGVEKYGRFLGRIYAQEYINLELVKKGLAHPYLVEEEEEEKFDRAQREARKDKRGLWAESPYAGCLEVEINKNEEYLLIRDSCNLKIKGWSIKDESSQYYLIKNEVGEEFTVWSTKGKANETDLFWGRENVWNNDGDSIFIRDTEGLLVYYDHY